MTYYSSKSFLLAKSTKVYVPLESSNGILIGIDSQQEVTASTAVKYLPFKAREYNPSHVDFIKARLLLKGFPEEVRIMDTKAQICPEEIDGTCTRNLKCFHCYWHGYW